MAFEKKILDVRKRLNEKGLDGWLFYDFRRSNELACKFLEISPEQIVTRRFFYWLPTRGEPIKIVHAIENPLEPLPGLSIRYRTWQELEARLADTLKGTKKIAMEYSPRNAIPYVSKVDGGTLDLVRSGGVEVVSSADLLQEYTSIWTSQQFQTHLTAANFLSDTVDNAWKFISQHIKQKRKLTEYQVQEFILREFSANGFICTDSPICAVNAHSADPHYTAKKTDSSLINPGDFILIDLWCKKNIPESVYADITRVAVAAEKPHPNQNKIFEIVKKARNTALGLVKERFASKMPLRGWEVDASCRKVIVDAGYGDFFTHRTGHNIGFNDHGDGAHIDDFETHDERLVIPGTCFSIEPGIYLPGEFGVRLEYDVFIHPDNRVQVTGGIQEEITCLI